MKVVLSELGINLNEPGHQPGDAVCQAGIQAYVDGDNEFFTASFAVPVHGVTDDRGGHVALLRNLIDFAESLKDEALSRLLAMPPEQPHTADAPLCDLGFYQAGSFTIVIPTILADETARFADGLRKLISGEKVRIIQSGIDRVDVLDPPPTLPDLASVAAVVENYGYRPDQFRVFGR